MWALESMSLVTEHQINHAVQLLAVAFANQCCPNSAGVSVDHGAFKTVPSFFSVG